MAKRWVFWLGFFFMLGISFNSFAMTHEDLIPFLVDLPGYVGDEPDGFTGVMGTTTASREYFKGGNEKKRFAVAIFLGAVPASTHQMFNNAKGSNGYFYQTKVKGFKASVCRGVDCSPCGGILVHLSKNCAIVVNYEYIPEKEALSLIKHFDLKAIYKATKNAKVPSGGMMMPKGGGMMPGGGMEEDSGDIGY